MKAHDETKIMRQYFEEIVEMRKEILSNDNSEKENMESLGHSVDAIVNDYLDDLEREVWKN